MSINVPDKFSKEEFSKLTNKKLMIFNNIKKSFQRTIKSLEVQ